MAPDSMRVRLHLRLHLPHATHVLDRFHVTRWFAAGLTLVRRDAQRREPRGYVRAAFDPELFRARFALLHRADTLTDHDQARLQQLFARHPRIRVGWQALQELYGLYLADDHTGALAALDRFCDLYATGQIPEFHDVVDTFLAWSTEILAYHQPTAGRPSNGRLEGTNNKLQVLRRVAQRLHQPGQLRRQRHPHLRSCDTITRAESNGTHPMNSRSLKLWRRWCPISGDPGHLSRDMSDAYS